MFVSFVESNENCITSSSGPRGFQKNHSEQYVNSNFFQASVSERGHGHELKTTKFELFGHDPCPGRYSTRKEKYMHRRSVPRLIRISQRTDP